MGFVGASVAVFRSVIITSAILGCYVFFAYITCLLVAWSVYGHFLPRWARLSGKIVILTIIGGGLALSLFEYFVEKRSDLAIVFFSLAYWVIALCFFAAGMTRLLSAGAFSNASGFGLLHVRLVANPFLFHLLIIYTPFFCRKRALSHLEAAAQSCRPPALHQLQLRLQRRLWLCPLPLL